MFVILVYDVGKKRVQRVMKKCRGYLSHVQRSVFEGNLTQAQLDRLKGELRELIEPREDAVCIYKVGSYRFTSRETIGVETGKDSVL